MCNNDVLFQIEWEDAGLWENIESVDSRGYHFYAIIAAPKINGELIFERGNILYIGKILTSGQVGYPEEDEENQIDAYMREDSHLNEQKIILLGKLVNDKSLKNTNEPLEDIKECLIYDNNIIKGIQQKPPYSGRPLKIENKNYHLPLKPRNCCVPLDVT